MFDFPEEIRKVTYTTNAIESLDGVIRKYTKNRKQYPSEQSALKTSVHGDPGGIEAMDPRPIKHWKQP